MQQRRSSSSSSVSSCGSSIEHETIVSESQYDSDGFDAESTGGAETEKAREQDTTRESEDGVDAYDDDVFEGDDADGAGEAADSDIVEDAYSADSFEALDASTPECEATCASDSYGSSGFDASESNGESPSHPTISLTVSSKNDDVVERSPVPKAADARVALAPEWCATKIQTFCSANTSANTTNGTTSSTLDHRIPLHTLDALRTQLARRPTSSQGAVDTDARSSSRSGGTRTNLTAALALTLPGAAASTLVDRARTARLLHTTFDHMVERESDDELHVSADAASMPMPEQLATFCAAKRAHLERKLATLRFADQYARGCTLGASSAREMSIETLEFVRDMVAAQRQSGTPSSSFSARALGLEATVATTKRCLRDSRSLRARAAQVLQPRNLHPGHAATRAT